MFRVMFITLISLLFVNTSFARDTIYHKNCRVRVSLDSSPKIFRALTWRGYNPSKNFRDFGTTTLNIDDLVLEVYAKVDDFLASESAKDIEYDCKATMNLYHVVEDSGNYVTPKKLGTFVGRSSKRRHYRACEKAQMKAAWELPRCKVLDVE